MAVIPQSPIGDAPSDHLVFTLHATIGSFGALAVGERRGGFERPAKSAVLGLVAAALGLERDDEDAQIALTTDFGLGLAAVETGRILIDYHTIQMPPQRRNRRFATRREELATDDLATVLSRREYRSGPCWIVVLWPWNESRWPLAALAAALQRPHFTLYLGRKSCPLALPVSARVVSAHGPADALAKYNATQPTAVAALLAHIKLDRPPSRMALEEAAIGTQSPLRIERRRDALVSRKRWQFDLRSEHIVALNDKAPS